MKQLWRQVKDAKEKGTLQKELLATYFTTPRPVYELYDLDEDPSELHNRSGDPKLAKVEAELRKAMAEKMLLDCDYLPFPQLMNR